MDKCNVQDEKVNRNASFIIQHNETFHTQSYPDNVLQDIKLPFVQIYLGDFLEY